MITSHSVHNTHVFAINNYSLSLIILLLTASFAYAENLNNKYLIVNKDDWNLGYATNTSKPYFDSEKGSISNQSQYVSYGIYNFDTPLSLNSAGDSLDFQFTLNIAYTGVPYGSSVGIGILTLYGDTNIHAGLGGVDNGRFNATTTSTEQKQNCYTFNSIASSGVTTLESALSIDKAIPNQKDTTISGHIKWNDEKESFAVHFSIGALQSEHFITLPDELSFTKLGFTLCGPSGSSATISNIMLNYSPAFVPEPSSSIMTLYALTLLVWRRKRKAQPKPSLK